MMMDTCNSSYSNGFDSDVHDCLVSDLGSAADAMLSWENGNNSSEIVSLDDCVMDIVHEDDEDDHELKYFMEHAKVKNDSDIGMWSDLSDDSTGNSSDDSNIAIPVSNDSTDCSNQDDDQDLDGEFLDSTVPLSYVVVQKPQTPPSPAYLDGLERLRTSMERTEASRKSLGVQTERTHQYDRSLCVVQIVQSAQNSSRRILDEIMGEYIYI